MRHNATAVAVPQRCSGQSYRTLARNNLAALYGLTQDLTDVYNAHRDDRVSLLIVFGAILSKNVEPLGRG